MSYLANLHFTQGVCVSINMSVLRYVFSCRLLALQSLNHFKVTKNLSVSEFVGAEVLDESSAYYEPLF